MIETSFNKEVFCAATQHVVDEVANSNPKFFKPKGIQDDYKVLLYLGFDIDYSLTNKNVTIEYDALIRSSKYPTKAYRCKLYNGNVRKAANKDKIKVTDPETGIVSVPLLHPKKYHHMLDVYKKVGILQASCIENFVSVDNMIDIQTINEK